MADESQQPDGATGDKSSGSLSSRIHMFREWTTRSRLRSLLVGGGLMLLVSATVGAWLYLAALTVNPHSPTIEQALEAYDQGELEAARLMVVKMTQTGDLATEEHAGPLFVLGAVKAAEAKIQWSALPRQSKFLVAAKYLREAQDIGFPPGHEVQGYYLLGQSLIGSGDNASGLEALEQALLLSPKDAKHLHLSLASAYQFADPPQLEKALEHIDTALADKDFPEKERAAVLLEQVTLLTDLKRFGQARAVLEAIPPSENLVAAKQLGLGRLELAEARSELSSADIPETNDTLRQKITDAVVRLQEIPTSQEQAQEAMYLAAEGYALAGETDSAIEQFVRVRKQFSSSPLGVAASIAEGDLYRTQKRNYQQALTAYRRGLTAIDEPRAYRNRQMPLRELKQRLLAAHIDFMNQRQYDAAHRLVELLQPLFGRTKQLELRAETLSNWASHLMSEADSQQANSAGLARDARRHYREAGGVYEELAERTFATTDYPTSVWLSGESYFLGQSYTSAVRMLDEYLRNEPVDRNAQALMRLGQSHLALDEVNKGIAALQECIELHPHDAAVFRARLDCAKAFRDQDDAHLAEKLLLANINDSGQSPKSPEWRDSLFELGHLLHESGRYEEAIDRLEEAVQRLERYGNVEQARLARYLVAESHRLAAEAPLTELQQAKTVNERESSTHLAQQHLTEALRYYEQVWADIANSEDPSILDQAMLRNCYMLKGSALFNLGRVEKSPGRFEEAIKAYSYVSTHYQHEPFVLETFVQIANCQRRLQQPLKAQLNIDRALQLLDQMPEDADFLATTNFNRSEWKLLLTQMLAW